MFKMMSSLSLTTFEVRSLARLMEIIVGCDEAALMTIPHLSTCADCRAAFEARMEINLKLLNKLSEYTEEEL